jgi:hypothetical protein
MSRLPLLSPAEVVLLAMLTKDGAQRVYPTPSHEDQAPAASAPSLGSGDAPPKTNRSGDSRRSLFEA